MKKQKNNTIAMWAFLFGMILSSTAFVNTVSAQSCPPSQFGCTDEATFSTTIVPKGYPTCTLSISYKLRICQGEFQIYGLSVSNLGVGCTQFITDIISLFLTNEPNPEAQATFARRFFNSAYTQIGDQLFDIAVAGGPLDLYLCDNPNSQTFVASFFNGTCTSLCVGRNNLNGSIVFDNVNCGNTCCKYSRTYCLDPKTLEPVVKEKYEEANAGNCISQTRPECEKQANVTPLFQSPCIAVCASN